MRLAVPAAAADMHGAATGASSASLLMRLAVPVSAANLQGSLTRASSASLLMHLAMPAAATNLLELRREPAAGLLLEMSSAMS